MKLVGMLDSPYVRRTAITLQLLGLPFEHQSLSVFRTFDAFRAINPAVKAPTLVCDDGTVLMDSTLLLQYAESLAHPRSLLPADAAALRRDLHLQGFALAACEKAVQLVYEHAIRPEDKRHAPWIERVRGQMRASFDVLERELAAAPLPVAAEALTQAAVTIAVVWTFVRETRSAGSHLDPASTWPALDALTDALEALPAFRRAPHGDGVVGDAR